MISSDAGVLIQSARLSQIGVNRQILKEGSSVLVRIIADRGSGKYEGSVAGVRVQMSSARALRPGDSFAATISVKNGSIVVNPKDISGVSGSGIGEIELSLNEVTQNQLFSLLEALGLPSDNLSSSILQAFKQMGLKLDSTLANKIRSIALRFGGKEKSAAEILSLIIQKGLEADEEEIKELLVFLENYNPLEKNEKESNEKLINRINSTEGAWYLLPFELVEIEYGRADGDDNRKVLGKGCIRLMFNPADALKILNLDYNYNNQKYLFSLAYEGKKIINTYFNVSSSENDIKSENEIISLKNHFMAAGINPGKITWTEKELLKGSASGLESFVSFGGQI